MVKPLTASRPCGVEINKSKVQERRSKVEPGYQEAVTAARYLQARWRTRPRVGIILGSGLGGVARKIRKATIIPYNLIPYFPQPTVLGHTGRLHLGAWKGVPVAVLEGRLHLYEGFTPDQVAFPTRVLALAGIETLIVTCAAGGIAPRAIPGNSMLFSDHLNFQGRNPLAGPYDRSWGLRFVDLSRAYDSGLRRAAAEAMAALRLGYFEGTYAAVLGPNYETPAEVRAFRRLGADAVGMSAVPEVLAARQLGVRVLAVATITNRAAGLSRKLLDHREVLAVGKGAARNLARFLEEFLPSI
jgi:purine-nucleoside phosphorylase